MPSSTTETDPRAAIRARAIAEGFDAVGFARAELPDTARAHLRAFLSDARHGTMAWMARNADRRADPKTLWPDAKSVIVRATPARGRSPSTRKATTITTC
jgi:epoxyqueuosine reductase